MSSLSYKARPFLASFTRALAVSTALSSFAGCATDPLGAAPPKGVDLTGEWQLNMNLSDDPQKMPADDTDHPTHMRRHGGRGGGGNGGLPPFGMPGGAGGRTGGSVPDGSDNFTQPSPDARTRWQIGGPGDGGGTGTAGPGGPGGGRSGRARGNRFGHLLDAPERMTIEQREGKLTIQSKSASGDLRTDEYASGQKSDVPFGEGTAERTAGWRGRIFVIDTKVKSGPTKEDDYALDDDGRLIVATLMTGGHMPKVDVKRVYDRVKGAQGVRQ